MYAYTSNDTRSYTQVTPYVVWRVHHPGHKLWLWEDNECKMCVECVFNEQEEPTASYIWIGWVWEITVEVQDFRKNYQSL